MNEREDHRPVPNFVIAFSSDHEQEEQTLEMKQVNGEILRRRVPKPLRQFLRSANADGYFEVPKKTGEVAAEALNQILAKTIKGLANGPQLGHDLAEEALKSKEEWWLESSTEEQEESYCSASQCTSCVIF